MSWMNLINYQNTMTINVQETEEGFTITWDPDDPIESQLNHWTEQDFIQAIQDKCNEINSDH